MRRIRFDQRCDGDSSAAANQSAIAAKASAAIVANQTQRAATVDRSENTPCQMPPIRDESARVAKNAANALFKVRFPARLLNNRTANTAHSTAKAKSVIVTSACSKDQPVCLWHRSNISTKNPVSATDLFRLDGKFRIRRGRKTPAACPRSKQTSFNHLAFGEKLKARAAPREE